MERVLDLIAVLALMAIWRLGIRGHLDMEPPPALKYGECN